MDCFSFPPVRGYAAPLGVVVPTKPPLAANSAPILAEVERVLLRLHLLKENQIAYNLSSLLLGIGFEISYEPELEQLKLEEKELQFELSDVFTLLKPLICRVTTLSLKEKSVAFLCDQFCDTALHNVLFLEIKESTGICDDDVDDLFNRFPSLTSLALMMDDAFGPEAIPLALERFASLECVVIDPKCSGAFISEDTNSQNYTFFLGKSAPFCLYEGERVPLDLALKDVSPQVILYLLPYLRSLKAIAAFDKSAFYEPELSYMLTRLRAVKKLSLKNCKLSEPLFSKIALMFHLKILVLSNCKEVTGECLALLAGLQQLKELRLDGCTSLRLADFLAITHIKSLKRLALCRKFSLSDVLMSACAALPKLKALLVTKARIKSIAQFFSFIQTVDVTICDQLDLSNLKDLTDGQAIELLKIYARVPEINLKGCTQLTGKILPYFKSLEDVELPEHLDVF